MSNMKYRSRFTGKEIDQLLASIDNKIDLSYISNDWNGGTQLVASAELAKTLYQGLQLFQDPNYIEELITSIPGSLVYTEADRDKLDRLAGFFQGSYANPGTRNAAVNTVGFKGGELTFLIDDDTSSGVQELSYWDNVGLRWRKAKFVPDQSSPSANYTSGGTVVTITMDVTKYSAGKYLLKAESATQIRVSEILLAHKGGNTFWTSYGEIGDGVGLASIQNASIVGDQVRINVLVSPNVTIRFFRLGEF